MKKFKFCRVFSFYELYIGEGKGHAVVVPRLLEPLLEDVVRVLGKRREVTEESEPHVLLSKERQFLDKRRRKEVHEEVDLATGPPPVLGRKRIGREHIKTKPYARRHGLPERVHACDVALRPLKTTRLGPTPVSIHDDRDMGRDALEVKIVERHRTYSTTKYETWTF